MGAEEGLCQCMGWGLVRRRGGFMSVYGVGDSGEQRMVHVSIWGGG